MGARLLRGGFCIAATLDLAAQRLDWPEQFSRIAIVVVSVGFFIALLAWYHAFRQHRVRTLAWRA